MRKILLCVAAMFAVVGCSKSDVVGEGEPKEDVVEVNFNVKVNGHSTKGSGEKFGINADDNTLCTLDLFVFRTEEGQDDYGVLEFYKRLTAGECIGEINISSELTVGKKKVVAIGNSKLMNWSNLTNLTEMGKLVASLQSESAKNYTMCKIQDYTVNKSETINFALERLISRVVVTGIRTKFEGTPYEGCGLNDVKIFLMNVQGKKYFLNRDAVNLQVLNNGRLVLDDVNLCAMYGILYESLATNIYDSGYNNKHYFYCYSNPITTEDETNKFTRLVIQGTINGITYYYPIVLKNLQENCSYSCDVTIMKPGSTDPSEDVSAISLNSVITVSNWQTGTPYSVVF